MKIIIVLGNKLLPTGNIINKMNKDINWKLIHSNILKNKV